MAFSFKQTISFLYVIIVLASTASSLRHDEECLALLQFKQTFIHQPYASFVVDEFHKFSSWRKILRNVSNHDDSDCCFWDGVLCSKQGHVIGLDLSHSSLHGPIKSNSSLFNLVHLQMLNLSMNDFVESQIPSEIARLNQLRILDLSYSRFNGQIPSEISQLVQLSSLHVGWNPLKLQSPSTLEYLLQNMTRLEELDLTRVDVSSSIPRFLANFSSLRLIGLGDCQLQDEFPSAIFQLPKLNILSLRNNTKLVGSLPEFHNNTLLKYLNLFTTGFGGTIPESIGKLNHLVFLVLDNCSFSGRIPGSLSNMTQLTMLGLGGNKFTGLVPSLESLSKLHVLDLSFNNFNKGRLLYSLTGLTKINQLHVQDINIYEEIPPSIANLTKLRVAGMSFNFIFGQIPSSFMNLTTLTFLDLAGNQLQGPISGAFSNFKNLVHLLLIGNKFNGTVDLDTFVRLNKLEVLHLGFNRLSFIATKNYTNGTLPQLRFFFINNNQLQGWLPIPPRTTIVYDVSNNDLTGKIPPSICEVKFLQHLALSYNKMIGSLPPCLGNLSNSLSVLNVNRNNFHGPMMNTFTPGCSLKEIDLSENRFTGQVSKSLANCSKLQFISLGDNSFVGLFPFWVGNFSELQVLILRSNKFYGEIQGLSTISGQFLKLRILDLSNNNFSGQLSDMSFENWNQMKYAYIGKSSIMGIEFSFNSRIDLILFPTLFPYSMTLTTKGVKRKYERILSIFTAIDLSCNNFVGEIPQSIQNLQGLQSLNLSNNQFTGHILPYLGNLKNLESLDLSQNELSGEIPQQLLQLEFLEIWNVSFNHLDGRIPQGNQFNTFDNSSYISNPKLCGQPLSNDCESLKATTSPSMRSQCDSLLPSDRIDWIFIFLGVGSGLTVGIVFGNILYAMCSDWFVEKFGLRKDIWIRPVNNKRRNQVLL